MHAQSDSLFSVDGLVVVISGGGSGLGAAMALSLDAHGARAVYILGRRATALDQVAQKAINGRIKPLQTDVTSKESLAAAAAVIQAEEGFIDALIANSGMIGPNTASLFSSSSSSPNIEQLQSTLWDIDMSDFTQTLHVNVTGAFYTALSFLTLLDQGNNKKRDGKPESQIIVTTSISAFTRTPAAGFAYSASKAAVTHLVKQLSTCLAPYKIRANAVAPGFFPSEMTENMSWMKQTTKDPRVEGGLSTQICPLGRSGSEEDIAGVMLFLLSRAGAYVNGCVQLVDGGRVSVLPATY